MRLGRNDGGFAPNIADPATRIPFFRRTRQNLLEKPIKKLLVYCNYSCSLLPYFVCCSHTSSAWDIRCHSAAPPPLSQPRSPPWLQPRRAACVPGPWALAPAWVAPWVEPGTKPQGHKSVRPCSTALNPCIWSNLPFNFQEKRSPSPFITKHSHIIPHTN